MKNRYIAISCFFFCETAETDFFFEKSKLHDRLIVESLMLTMQIKKVTSPKLI